MFIKTGSFKVYKHKAGICKFKYKTLKTCVYIFKLINIHFKIIIFKCLKLMVIILNIQRK
jgi:hypothetical protein